MSFSLTGALTAADQAKLVLHVGSDSFAFSDAAGPSGTQTYTWEDTGLDWSMDDFVTLRLREAPAASTDATLSGLVVNDGAKDLALTPGFASGTTSYSASVANEVGEVTVTATPTDAGASIEYLDGSDMTLADADTDAGHQVAVADGDTVIKVKVTAEDGDTTQIYTVTVNRAAATTPTCTLNTGDVWCGVVTVSRFLFAGVVYVEGFGPGEGDLSYVTTNNAVRRDASPLECSGDFRTGCSVRVRVTCPTRISCTERTVTQLISSRRKMAIMFFSSV